MESPAEPQVADNIVVQMLAGLQTGIPAAVPYQIGGAFDREIIRRMKNSLRLRLRNPCVYLIESAQSRKKYVGSACDMRDRRRGHLALLRKGKHHSPPLQRSFIKRGEANFVFYPLVGIEPDDLLIEEQKWMDQLQTYEKEIGYNISRFADAPTRGRKMPRTRAFAYTGPRGKDHPWYGKKLRQPFRFLDPAGNSVVVDKLASWAAAQGLCDDSLRYVAKGQQESHRGWTRDPAYPPRGRQWISLLLRQWRD